MEESGPYTIEVRVENHSLRGFIFRPGELPQALPRKAMRGRPKGDKRVKAPLDMNAAEFAAWRLELDDQMRLQGLMK